MVRYVRADRELDDEGEPVDVALLDESPPVYDVEVRRYEPDPQDPQDVEGWSAEGGVRDASVGTDFEFTASLAELLGWVQEEVDALRQRRAELRVVCTLDGSEAEMQAVAQEEGAALPR